MHKDVNKIFISSPWEIYCSTQQVYRYYNSFLLCWIIFLVRRSRDREPKLPFKWFGPCCITAVNSYLVYVYTPLRRGNIAPYTLCSPNKVLRIPTWKKSPEETLDLADRTQSSYQIIEKSSIKAMLPTEFSFMFSGKVYHTSVISGGKRFWNFKNMYPI